MKRGFLFVGLVLVVGPGAVCGMQKQVPVHTMVDQAVEVEEQLGKDYGGLAQEAPFTSILREETEHAEQGHSEAVNAGQIDGSPEKVQLTDHEQIATFVGDLLEGVRFRTLRENSQSWKTNVKYSASEGNQPVMKGTEEFIDFVLPEEERSEEALFLLDVLEQLLREYQRIGAVSVDFFVGCLHMIANKYSSLKRDDIVQFWLQKASYLLLPDAFVSELVQLFSEDPAQRFSQEIGKDFVNQINSPHFQERLENITRFLRQNWGIGGLPLFMKSEMFTEDVGLSDLVNVSDAEKIIYDAFIASGLNWLGDQQIANPYARELIQTLNSRTAPGNELIPGIRRYEDIPAHFTKMLQHMERGLSVSNNQLIIDRISTSLR